MPLAAGLLLGATYDRLESESNPFQIKPEDDTRNFEALKAATAIKAIAGPKASRASIRVTTANTLPIISQLSTGQWAFTGLGSRGFVFAPLLAEALVSKLCGEPMPVSKALWERLQTP